MNWIPIMRLPDGVTVEMRVPATSTDCGPDLHCYRVREPDHPATELLTLRDVAAHLHAHCRPEVLDEICIGHHRDVGDHRSEP